MIRHAGFAVAASWLQSQELSGWQRGRIQKDENTIREWAVQRLASEGHAGGSARCYVCPCSSQCIDCTMHHVNDGCTLQFLLPSRLWYGNRHLMSLQVPHFVCLLLCVLLTEQVVQ